ncbi:MAG: hypothetical protein ACE5LG_01095 [Anaerolineae bacterium]
MSKREGFLTLLFLLGVALGGCAGPRTTPRASPDWSKGQPVGMSALNNPVAIQAGEGVVYLTWVDGEHRLHWARLDEKGQVVADKSLDLPTRSSQKPRLLLGPLGRLHLFWIASKEEGQGLYYVQLNPSGEVISDPLLLSLPGMEVGYVTSGLSAQGQIELFWSQSAYGSPGVYNLTIDPGSLVASPNALIAPQGIAPTLQVDQEGTLHLSWFEEPTHDTRQIYYATFDPERRVLGEVARVAEVVLRGGQIMVGPVLGLDLKNCYIFWSIEQRGRAVGGDTFYASFPLGRPAESVVMELRVPPTKRPRYDSYAGEYAYHLLASQEGATSTFLSRPWVVDGQRSELPVVLSINISTRLGEHLQIAMLVFSQGQLKGYQIVTATRMASLSPHIVADPGLGLHLAWIDTAGFEEYQVLYASTSPQVKEVLNRVTLADVVDKGGDLMMALLLVVGFTPVLIAWLVLPLVWLLIFYLLTGEGELTTLGAWVALGVAMVMQLLAMTFITPGGRGLLPFLAISIPQVAPLFTGWLFPILLAILGLGAMAFYLWRTRSRSLFGAFFVFAFTAGLLRLFIFVLTYLGFI